MEDASNATKDFILISVANANLSQQIVLPQTYRLGIVWSVFKDTPSPDQDSHAPKMLLSKIAKCLTRITLASV